MMWIGLILLVPLFFLGSSGCCCPGGNDGEEEITVLCCPNPQPTRLFATFTPDTSCDGCVGITFPIEWDGTQWVGEEEDIGCGTIQLNFLCNALAAWQITGTIDCPGVGFGGAINKTATAINDCDPLDVVFQLIETFGCCFIFFEIQVTE